MRSRVVSESYQNYQQALLYDQLVETRREWEELIGWEYMFMLEIIVYRDCISNFLGAQESIPPAYVACAEIL
jgi:hypothetical protein